MNSVSSARLDRCTVNSSKATIVAACKHSVLVWLMDALVLPQGGLDLMQMCTQSMFTVYLAALPTHANIQVDHCSDCCQAQQVEVAEPALWGRPFLHMHPCERN